MITIEEKEVLLPKTLLGMLGKDKSRKKSSIWRQIAPLKSTINSLCNIDKILLIYQETFNQKLSTSHKTTLFQKEKDFYSKRVMNVAHAA